MAVEGYQSATDSWRRRGNVASSRNRSDVLFILRRRRRALRQVGHRGRVPSNLDANIEEKDIAGACGAGPTPTQRADRENDRARLNGHIEGVDLFQALRDGGYGGWLTSRASEPTWCIQPAVAIWTDMSQRRTPSHDGVELSA